MPLAERLNAVLEGFILDREIEAVVVQWPYVDPSSIEKARLHLSMQLDNLQTYASTMRSPDSASELYEALAYWYMEARCEWAQVNLSSNHQLWTTGVADQSLLIRGTVGSSLLTKISRLMRKEDVDYLENGLINTLNGLLYPMEG
jgi:hypothetical protein